MVDFFIFDINFNRLGVIDNPTAVIWERNLYKLSNCEIQLSPSKEQIEILKDGNIIIRKDNKNEAMVIVSRQINNINNVETMILKCYSLSYYLYNRYTLSDELYIGEVEKMMHQMIKLHFINPININRRIEYIKLGNLNGFNEMMNRHISLKCVGEELFNISRESKVNFRLSYNIKDKCWVFETFKGIDRTYEQNINNRAIFSTEFENINNQQLLESSTNYKNVCYVYGSGEGTDRNKIILNDKIKGLNRKEVIVDARDISKTKEDGSEIDDDNYNEILKDRGKSKLNDYKIVSTFDFILIPNNTLIYKKDFDLGDKVTILNKKWGIRVNDYITSIRETYDTNGFNIDIEIGEKNYKIMKG